MFKKGYKKPAKKGKSLGHLMKQRTDVDVNTLAHRGGDKSRPNMTAKEHVEMGLD